MPASPSDLKRLKRLRRDVESFLIEEAWLLDEWRLDDWLSLFAKSARYVVPSTDLPHGDPKHDLVLIDDDFARLRARIERLQGGSAHRERPWSRTRRIITNVRIAGERAGILDVTAYFQVFRFRMGQEGAFVGRYLYELEPYGDSFRILFRRAELDMETLSVHGAISIIL